MNDPRIANPLIIANEIYNETGTMGATNVTCEDIDMMLQTLLDPETGLVSMFRELPTRVDVARAYQILGATIV